MLSSDHLGDGDDNSDDEEEGGWLAQSTFELRPPPVTARQHDSDRRPLSASGFEVRLKAEKRLDASNGRGHRMHLRLPHCLPRRSKIRSKMSVIHVPFSRSYMLTEWTPGCIWTLLRQRGDQRRSLQFPKQHKQ